MPLKTQRQYRQALTMVDQLTNEPETLKTAELNYLSVLGRLITDYEKEHLPSTPDIAGAQLLFFLMQQNNLTLTALAKEIGGQKSNLSGFLNGSRGLSKKIALALASRFNVSPAVFL
jgi:HTH-type transcriptional regulator/antitoxin HigA